MTLFYKTVRAIITPFIRVFFPCRFIGIQNIPKDKSFMVCSNHISYIDPVFIILGIKGKMVHFMAKDSIFNTFILGRMLKGMGAFPVKRGVTDMTAIRTAQNILKTTNSHSVLGIFPEGKRSKTGALLNGKAGAAMLSDKFSADILPVAIFTKGGKVRLFKKTSIVFGELIMNSEMNFEKHNSNELKNATKLIMNRIAILMESNGYESN